MYTPYLKYDQKTGWDPITGHCTQSENQEMSFKEMRKLNHIPTTFYIHHQRAEFRDKATRCPEKTDILQ